MIERDRVLLLRLARLNEHIGTAVVDLLPGRDGIELASDGLRALADALNGVAADLRVRAAELDGETGGPHCLPVSPGASNSSGDVE